jgi:hypothetical protein
LKPRAEILRRRENLVKKIRFDGFFASDAKKMIENALIVMFFVDATMREAE